MSWTLVSNKQTNNSTTIFHMIGMVVQDLLYDILKDDVFRRVCSQLSLAVGERRRLPWKLQVGLKAQTVR